CHTLEAKYNREMMELENTSKHQAFLRHLRLYQIIDAEIPGIGPGRKQALMFHGIVSAADIEEERILAIAGFGERLTSYLLDWKEEVIEQFTFDARRDVSLKDRQSINQKYCKLQNDILRNVESRIAGMVKIKNDATMQLKEVERELRDAMMAYRQAAVDIENLSKYQGL
ncbi:MAG: hypothetical protein NZM31_04045, partial [Gemmatales bacterium]|nr:hypothetical protein [Gemmatales bacterium]MDW8386171.1 hypothetical protein [Gemmatales bacterium]